MNVRDTYINLQSRFNAMSLRERGMMAGALLALVVLAWDQLLMNPLRVKQAALTQEIGDVQSSIKLLNETISGRAEGNPLSQAMQQKQELTRSLAAVDAQLQSEAAGLIAPQRMLAALRDVLAEQRALRLVSARNLPVTSLLAAASPPAATNGTAPTPVPDSAPYVHAMELVVEGGYLDVLTYLQKVEALPWRFYWQVLELKSTEYPLNRVRIRLNTLSMDKEWLGV